MMPASKHGDPQLGVDIHLCVVPPSPSPVPLPTPHMSVVFDPFDYIPIIGATISVCGMKRATAGTSGIAVHIPPGFPFAPMLPQKDDELFMGSATVVADGDPFSYIALPVLSCQVAGMPSIPRPRKKGPKKMMLGPLVFNLAIPTNVFVGGPPTISLLGLAMKGAFAGLGKIAKSGVFKRMRQKLFKNMKPGFLKCSVLRAEPVNILSGAVSVEHLDFVLPGRIPVEWRRVYGSDNRHAGHCGHGWETPADGRLEIDHDGVLMHYPGIGPLYFNGVPVAEGEAAAELELQDGAVLTDVDGEYRVRTKADRIYHFPKRSIVRRPDGGQSIALDKIADLCGNHLQFERDRGVLIAIHESAGRRLEFRTDAGRIQRIGLVTPESPERHAYVRYDYDAAGDLVAVRDALDHPHTFAYDAHHLVRHTDRNGLSFYYEYDSATAERRVVHAWGDGGLYDYRFEYSDVLRERRITDSLGHVSVVKLNEQDLPINEIDALGGVTIYEYDDAGRTIAVTNQDGARFGYRHDERGNVLEVVRPDGVSFLTEFNDSSKATRITDAAGGEWQQAWDGRGLLISQITPLGDTVRYEYDEYGQLAAYSDARGHRSEIKCDVYGNLARITDPLGRRTRFGYDVRGNLTGKLDASSNKTLYGYDAQNRLIDVSLPSNKAVHCAYDREGNLTRYVDEGGAEICLEYFGLGQVAKRVQPDGSAVEYFYDTEERLIGLRNPRGESWRLVRDPLGHVVEEIDFWGQSRRYEYSPAGCTLASTDPLNRRITYVNDPLGQVLAKSYRPQDGGMPSEESFEYDANGNLIAASNQHIQVRRSFDAQGRLLEEKQGENCIISNVFDANGNRILRTSRLICGSTIVDRRVAFSYDVLNQVEAIQIDEQPPVLIERNATGQVVLERYGAELRRELEYGQDGLLARQRVRAGAGELLDVAYRYDGRGNLIERRDAVLGIDRFIYDPLGQITQHLDPQGKITRYLQDPAGDRLLARSAERDPLVLPQGDWWREATLEDASYRFDRAGNLIHRLDRRGELRLLWDANQRLTETCMNGATVTYRYDALGRRIEKQSAGRTSRFGWDGDALSSEVCWAAADVDRISEWVYLPRSFEPLAMLSGKPGDQALLYYNNDPNGCPRRMFSAEGEIKWAASFSAWGAITSLQAACVEQPLRLQGQFEDAETGLYYNRYRYFDCEAGQFCSRDPLGLLAGSNVYAYAPNIWSWIDPLGLACRPAYLAALSDEHRKIMEAVLDRAEAGAVRKRHGHFENLSDTIDVIKNPTEVFVSSGKNQRLILHDGDNVVIIGTKGSEKGWVVTDYGPRGSAQRAAVGAEPNTPRGGPVTRDDIVQGTIPSSSGNIPPGQSVWKAPSSDVDTPTPDS